MLSIKICECLENHGIDLKKKIIEIKTNRGNLFINPLEETESTPKFGFCKHCHLPYLSKDLAKTILHNAVKKKQKELGCLTGDEIKQMRKKMGLSLRAFGEFLQIPYTNICHWETYNLIQDRATDQYIRIKYSQYLNSQHPQRKRLKKVFMVVIQNVDTSKIFLNKILFYIDFWHFRKFSKSITGTNYIPLQYGPCPENYHEILKEMIDERLIYSEKGHRFRLNVAPNMMEFNADEIQTIDEVTEIAKTDKGKKLFDLSHEEAGFLETPLYQTISYEKYSIFLRIEELLKKD